LPRQQALPGGDLNAAKERLMRRFKREFYLEKLTEKLHTDQAKVIAGVKGCGKTFLLF
jgi:predicted AAA+ superfamily ATPase